MTQSVLVTFKIFLNYSQSFMRAVVNIKIYASSSAVVKWLMLLVNIKLN